MPVPSSPLPVLLSKALVAFTQGFERTRGGDGGAPSLPVWSNLLRVMDEGGVDKRDLPRRACISKRAMRMLAAAAERQGWLAVDTAGPSSRSRQVGLTAEGRRALERGRSLVEATEARWRTEFGAEETAALRAALQALVGDLDLELSYYPASYGAGDDSIAGGSHVPGQAGPPRIPAHGQELPITVRDKAVAASDLPLSALLSQPLVAFAMDYENEGLGSLATAANTLRFLPDAGVPLAEAPSAAAITGSGRSRLERHGIVSVERHPERPRMKLVRLTLRGRRMRDGYEALLAEIEQRWQVRYGSGRIGAVHQPLKRSVGRLDADLPHFPVLP